MFSMKQTDIERAQLEEKARMGRRLYDREYRKKNKERLAEYQRNYWARKAELYQQHEETCKTEPDDWLRMFLTERCTVEKSAKVRCGELYSAYKQYVDDEGYKKLRLADFNAAMKSAGFMQMMKHGNRKYWNGVCIKCKSEE